ncbi:unnamed protein product [Withania somnifera]
MFDGMDDKNVVCWNSMISKVEQCNVMLAGYAEMRWTEDLCKLFMRTDTRDVASWTSMKARSLFEDMPGKDVVAWTAMIKGYYENNNVEEARKLFEVMPQKDIIAWNSMLSGYLQNGRLQDALHLFHMMSWEEHNDITSARELFEKMPRKDETSWNTIISGYQNEEAFALYITFCNVVSLCGVLALYGWGRALHACSAFISMYSRCGFIFEASSLFRNMRKTDTIAWNAMIVAQACHGSAKDALKFFPCMILAGYEPDHVTYLGLLTACAHFGLVDEGWSYFISMEKRWSIIPNVEHYNCMIDLLGRSGMLAEAFELVNQFHLDLPAILRRHYLVVVEVHENFYVSDLVAGKLLSFQPSDIGMSVLLSNMYSARGMWKDATRVRALLKKHDLKKELACSWIEINGCISQFVSNGRCDPRAMDIYKTLGSLAALIEDSGTLAYQGCYLKFGSSEEINIP